MDRGFLVDLCSLHAPCFLLPLYLVFLVLFAGSFSLWDPFIVDASQGFVLHLHSTYTLALNWQSYSFSINTKTDSAPNYTSRPYLPPGSFCMFNDLLKIFIGMSHRHFKYNISFPTSMLASFLNTSFPSLPASKKSPCPIDFTPK